jgi:hypothetical protein
MIETVYATRATCVALGTDRFLAHRTARHPQPLDRLTASALRACRGIRTMSEHAIAVQHALSLDAAEATRLITILQTTELLERVDLRPARENRKPAKPIDAVGIITADRPIAFARCLAAILEEREREGSRFRVVVIDGSRHAPHREQNRASLASRATMRGVGTTYVGPAEAKAIRQCLEREGLSSSSLEMGLTPGEIGANRNLLMIVTAGERVVTVDDDIVPHGWAQSPDSGRCVVDGHEDVRPRRFYETRVAAINAAQVLRANVFSSHGDVLGRDLESALTNAPTSCDASSACGHVIEALLSHRELLVRVTSSGIAGDTGGYCPYYDALFACGTTRGQLMSDPAELAVALGSREVHRVADVLTLRHDPRCMAYCMGMANDAPLPPFIPIGRNEDGVFGAMLSYVRPDSVFADLPHAVLHESEREPAYCPGQIPSATATRLCDVLFGAMHHYGGGTEGDFESRVRILATGLRELSRLDEDGFTGWFGRAVSHNRVRALAALTARSLGGSSQWHQAIRTYTDQLWSSFGQAEFLVPLEFRGRPRAEGVRALRGFLGDYSDLLESWSDAWKHAKASDLPL